ncbi:hypothetical protein BDV93DRAFT_529765 [Ceratobasidium sp. AG-I]|nr:hypothetical protein BDV93DRAFT_529765 [Ceratobasidium sp. AG-I]
MDSRDPVEPIPNNEFTGIPEAHRRESVVGSEHEDGHNPKPSRRDSLNEPSSFAASLTDINDGIEQLKANQDQTNQRLDEMQDRLKDGLEQAFGRVVEKVTGLIVELQNQPTQGANSSSDRAYHHIVNEDEEASSPDSLTMSKRVDTFNTSQIRAWNRPQLKNSMEVIEAVHFNGCPIGLNCLDFNNKANLRIKAHIDGLNIDPNSMITKATVHLNAYADTVLYSAGCTWLDVGKQDRDFQFGEYLTGQWTENANESSIQVRFDKPYASVPRVLVWLKHIDASHTANCRISAQASDITATGFTLNVWTWADTIMYRATAVWIAHSSTRSNVTSGNFNTMDIRSWDMPQLENGAFITFDKEFERPPRVLVALNSLDVSNHTNLRIKAITKNVTTKGMKINIDSWHDTVLYSAGASWLAIQDY